MKGEKMNKFLKVGLLVLVVVFLFTGCSGVELEYTEYTLVVDSVSVEERILVNTEYIISGVLIDSEQRVVIRTSVNSDFWAIPDVGDTMTVKDTIDFGDEDVISLWIPTLLSIDSPEN